MDNQISMILKDMALQFRFDRVPISPYSYDSDIVPSYNLDTGLFFHKFISQSLTDLTIQLPILSGGERSSFYIFEYLGDVGTSLHLQPGASDHVNGGGAGVVKSFIGTDQRQFFIVLGRGASWHVGHFLDDHLDLSAGTGIGITGDYPSLTITNTDPDQTVVLTGGSDISVTGAYPSFTIDNDAPDQVVVLTGGSDISVTGAYPSFTIDNDAPDQVVTLTSGGGCTIGGAYPNFTVTVP